MKLSAFTLLFTLVATSIFAQKGENYIQLSDKITTETKKITGFDKIDVSEDFKVYVRFSDKAEELKIEANENLHQFIKVEKEGSTLKISTKSYSTNNWNQKSGAQERLVAYITTKQLTEIKADEDVVIVLEDKLSTDNLAIYLNEDSTLKGHLEVGDLTVELKEDSVLDIEGTAKSMDVKAREDSILKSFDFVVENLTIDLHGDSEAKITVNGDIDLRAKGDSYFYYRGEGNFIRKSLSGDSEVRGMGK